MQLIIFDDEPVIDVIGINLGKTAIRALRAAYWDLHSISKDFMFPYANLFSVERFVEGLELVCWKYDGLMRNARKPVCQNGDCEKVPGILFEYNFDKLKDLENAVKNAELRARNHKADFSSEFHRIILVQELYEAGWKWIN